ncbi:MAG TPA: class I SAM-dependent methyltransferase [Reyranellaceae bacterium]|nr:class I SAM-dependent methyltransferase [Reyranellaceae bacterium]
MKVSDHYGSGYFSAHIKEADFGVRAELVKFAGFVKPTDAVLDFGCGSGLILSNLKCRDKLGVEINPHARAHCAELGLKAVATLDEVPDGWADLVITNHALEHVPDPVVQLGKLRAKLKPGAKLVAYVPCERADSAYDPDDKDRHLYTWTPLNAGNLMWAAGYKVLESRLYHHRVPPGGRLVERLLGQGGLDWATRVYGRFYGKIRQVRVIAEAAT